MGQHVTRMDTERLVMIRNVLTRRREYGTYLPTAAVPAESYVIHLSSASLVSCDVYGQCQVGAVLSPPC